MENKKVVYESPATIVVEVKMEGHILQASRTDEYGYEMNLDDLLNG